MEQRRSVRAKLRNGEYRLSTKKQGRSKVWEHFRTVTDREGKSVGYAACTYCLIVIKHNSHLTGTSTLFGHLRSCSGSPDRQDEKDAAAAAALSEIHIKEENLTFVDDEAGEPQGREEENEGWGIFLQTADVCAEYVATDMVLYQALQGKGFKKLAQFLVNCGAEHGKFDVASLIPQPPNLVHRVGVWAGVEREGVREAVQCCVTHGAAVSLLQLSQSSHSSPLTVVSSLHFLRDWKLQTEFLSVYQCGRDTNLRETVKSQVLGTLSKFGLDIPLEKLVVICGKELIPPLKEATQIISFSDMINQSVTQLLKTDSSLFKTLRECLQKCKQIINLARELNVKLSVQVNEGTYDNQPEWIEMTEMAEIVYNHRLELLANIQQPDLQDALSSEREVQMRHLIKILKPCKAAVEDVEHWEKPKLHKVVPWFTHLQDTCKHEESDADDLTTLKKIMKQTLHDNTTLDLLHKVAVFFNPRMSSLRILNPADRDSVRKEIIRLGQYYNENNEQPKKKQKKEDSPLAYLEDEEQEHESSNIEREIQLYTIMKDNTDDLLTWWQHNSSMLPVLASVALRVLAVPASSKALAPHVRQIVEKIEHSGSWNPDYKIDDLVFLHSRLSRSSVEDL